MLAMSGGKIQIGCHPDKEGCCNHQVIVIISTWTLKLTGMVLVDHEDGCVDYVTRVRCWVAPLMIYGFLYWINVGSHLIKLTT